MNLAYERYARQTLLPGFEKSAERFLSQRVGIVGVGGLGALCAYLLAGAGVGELRLADGDVVSLSNLHRQVLYDSTMVGQSKAQCAKARIAALDPHIKVITMGAITQQQDFATLVAGLDLLLLLTDTQASRVQLSAWALAAKIPTLIACVAGFNGLSAYFDYASADFVAKYGCYRCLCGHNPEPQVQGILGPTAAQMASATALSALQILNGTYPEALYGRVVVSNLQTQQTQRFKLKRDAYCEGCNQHAD